MIFLFVLLGIGCEIVIANGWFIIPEFVPHVLFGVAGILLIINVFSWISAKRKFNKMDRWLKGRWRR